MNCPNCHSVELEANTWEAWCYDCTWRITADEDPELFQAVRDAELQRRAEVAKVFERLAANGVQF